MGAASGRLEAIDEELSSIQEQLGQAKVDKHESSRAMKKAELLENLKRLFPGVVSLGFAWWPYSAHTFVMGTGWSEGRGMKKVMYDSYCPFFLILVGFVQASLPVFNCFSCHVFFLTFCVTLS